MPPTLRHAPPSRVAAALASRSALPSAALPISVAAALAVALSACSGASAPEPLACTERSQCPADAFCRAGACVQSAPPVARVASLETEPLRENRVVAFDASASGDPDAEDQVVSFAWRAERVSAACEPSIVEAASATYRVLFPCAGEFLIEVVATDSTGAQSAPATVAVSVAADEVPPPALRAGAALELDHRCEGEPLSCTPVAQDASTTFTLSVTSTGGRPPVALRWTASPPQGLDTSHLAAFSDPTDATPTVALRTSGPIAGAWRFSVVATDADGRAAVAEQMVTIRNRDPVLAEPLQAVAVPHRHDAADASYRAEGAVPAPPFVDPDGDPVSVRFVAEATGDGGRSFVVGPDGAFSIRIPSAEPQHLIGEGVARTVSVEASDGNGGDTIVGVPVEVTNRRPRISLARSVATVPHRYDPERRVYTADATLSDYVDDDGDPILPGSTFELVPAGCSALALSGATLGLTCEVPLSTVAALATLARAHVLDVTVRDPWDPSARATARIDVTNQPPRVTQTHTTVVAPASVSNVCCYWDDYEEACGATPIRYAAGDGSFSAVVDPDGDPLDVTFDRTSTALLLTRASASACTGAECAVGLHLDAAGSLTGCVEIPDPGTLRVTVTDGAASASGSVFVLRSDR